jgi:hypothetical protein
MDLKDKLDIIWKYSILLIILVSLICFHSNVGKRYGRGYYGKGHYGQWSKGSGYMGMGYGKQIKVEKQIIEGDTTVVVWVGGKQIDNPEEFLARHKCDPDMMCCELHGMKQIKMKKMKKEEVE